MQKSIKFLLGAVLALGLAACGGGGSSDGSPCLAVGGCGGTTPSDTVEYTVKVAATESGTTVSTTNLAFGKNLDLLATVTDKAGKPVSGAKIDFALSDSKVASLTNGGSVLSDANGQGKITVLSLNNTDQGVLTVTTTATINVGTGGSATTKADFTVNSGSQGPQPGPPTKLRYLNTSVARLFVRGASSGNTNANETTQVKFEVRDASDIIVPGATVYFDLSKRNENVNAEGLLICTPDVQGRCQSVPGSGGLYAVKSDTNGVATVTIQSGSEPISVDVLAALEPFVAAAYDAKTGLAGSVRVWLSTSQVIVSSNIPHQNKILINWASGATCLGGGIRQWPCTFIVSVFDKVGQPVADGTAVNVVTATGGVVMESLSGQPSGVCLTKDSQCKGNFTGKPNVPLGAHIIVAYVNSPKGEASKGQMICDSGVGSSCPTISWPDLWVTKPISGEATYKAGSVPSTLVLAPTTSDNYIRTTLNDAGASYCYAGLTGC